LKTKLRQQQANTSNHEVLHSATAVKVSSLKQAVQDVNSNHTTLSSTTNKLSTSVNAHAGTLKSLKTQQDAHSDGLINHRDILRKCVKDISELQSSIKMHQQKTDDTWFERTSLSERTGALENQVSAPVRSLKEVRSCKWF
jgi:chromosome segregation ATPase